MIKRWVSVMMFPVFLLAAGTNSQEKPNFSGEWTLNKQKSRLKVKKLEEAVATIDHQEPNFHFHRTFVINGKDHTFSYNLTTDGKEIVSQKEKETIYSRLYWEKDVLVFDVRIVSKAGEATNKVKYRLTNEGRTLVAEEQYRSANLNYDNLWVLDKK